MAQTSVEFANSKPGGIYLGFHFLEKKSTPRKKKLHQWQNPRTRSPIPVTFQNIPLKTPFFSMNVRILQDPESGLVNDLSGVQVSKTEGISTW